MMQIKQIDFAKLQPTERQWIQNGCAGLDGFNKLAIMPLKTPKNPSIPKEWGKYVDTYTNKIYQIDIYEFHLVYKDDTETRHYHNAAATPFRKALYEKTLKGHAWIFLFENSTLGYANSSGQYSILTSGVPSLVVDICYAFNRLILTTEDTVYWSALGMNSHTGAPSNLGKNDVWIDGGGNKKQSDVITKEYLGTYTDFVNLYLLTRGGYEVWRPTQDSTNPFIYSTAMPCRIADFDNQYAILETEEHRLGLFNVLANEFMTDERWFINPQNIIDMKSFWFAQNSSKCIAIYEKEAMWLYDVKHKLMTKIDKQFYPHYGFEESYLNMQVCILADKGIYGSLFIQLGQFPEEIQFYMDNFYMKHAPLLAFERDDVIKTVNIGKLTVDTPLELNFKGYTSIYSLGLATTTNGG